ncbi:MAG: hypothetical protein M3436_18705, partial [Pseudomonadota bacterium]|nr:hypothetical protein [Pseudomonadota bacterium]
LRGIYTGAEPKIDETNLFFHWNYLNEEQKKQPGGRQDHTGIYVIGLHRAAEAARVSRDIDALFKNSMAETLTETEKAFQLGFVAMTEAILMVGSNSIAVRDRHHPRRGGEHDDDGRAGTEARVRHAESPGIRFQTRAWADHG